MNLDPATAAVARHKKAIEISGVVYDECGSTEAWRETDAAKECHEAYEALSRVEPVTLDGLLSQLRYIMEWDRDGADVGHLMPMLRSAERGLRKMRKAD
jgi:hypothetical protein